MHFGGHVVCWGRVLGGKLRSSTDEALWRSGVGHNYYCEKGRHASTELRVFPQGCHSSALLRGGAVHHRTCGTSLCMSVKTRRFDVMPWLFFPSHGFFCLSFLLVGEDRPGWR